MKVVPTALVAGIAATTLGLSGAALASGPSTPAASSATAAPTTSGQAGQADKARAGQVHRAGRTAVHGEFVRRGKAGSFVTISGQRGEVTAISPTSLTLRSADGFDRTYVLGPDTHVRVDNKEAAASAVEVGQHARVVARRTDGTWTARRVAAHS